jgi:hypothetical protein
VGLRINSGIDGADQSWLVGPIAKAIRGADIGWELVSRAVPAFGDILQFGHQSAAAAAPTVYVSSRMLELRFLGR